MPTQRKSFFDSPWTQNTALKTTTLCELNTIIGERFCGQIDTYKMLKCVIMSLQRIIIVVVTTVERLYMGGGGKQDNFFDDII